MKRLAIIPAMLAALLTVMPMSAQAAEPERVLRVGLASDPESLDPMMQLSGNMLSYSHWVFDPLVRWTKDMELEPRLAESWEQINPTTMRFHLREGVKFHSGNPFTAKDVVWTVERLKKSIDFRGLFEIFSATAVDDYTVDIVTDKPYSLVMNLATYIFPMDSVFYTGTDDQGKPKDAISKTDYSFANENASGTGPFKAIKREAGVLVLLDENENYWTEKGNVDQVRVEVIGEGTTRVAGILANNVDFMSPVPVQDYTQIEKNPDIKLITMPSTRTIVFQMNGTINPALADKRVREAIIRGTDNAGIAKKVMRGATIAVHQNAPKGMQGYDESLVSRYDVEKAKALLAEAGYAEGLELTMIAPNDRYINDEKIAQAFVPMMARIGIKVNLRTMPKSQYWNEFDLYKSDIQMIGWHPDTEDSVNFGEYLLMCPNAETGKGQYNSGRWCNEEYDAIMNAANQETDQVKREEMLKKAEKIAYDDAAFIPLHLEPLSWAAGPNFLNPEEVVNAQDFLFLGEANMK